MMSAVRAMHDWLSGQVQKAEEKDLMLRLLKDDVKEASRRSHEAAARSQDGLVPKEEQRELESAIGTLIRHADGK
jgi:hypothetical protein